MVCPCGSVRFLREIDLVQVQVFTPGGSVLEARGGDCRWEIAYARQTGKPVRSLEPLNV